MTLPCQRAQFSSLGLAFRTSAAHLAHHIDAIMGRQILRSRKDKAAAHHWADLPTDVALLVLQHLSARDKKALALACCTGRSWVQIGRSAFRVTASSMKELQAACDQLGSQARTLRLIHAAADAGRPLLSLQARRLSLPMVSPWDFVKRGPLSLLTSDLGVHNGFCCAVCDVQACGCTGTLKPRLTG